MRILLQRVASASVSVHSRQLANIGPGLVLLVGIGDGDTQADAQYLSDKLLNLRIFEDSGGKFSLSAIDIKAEILVVSQFTLYADVRKGRRPSFTDAAPLRDAEALFQKLVAMLKASGLKVETGQFGEHMLVNINNDGPVTIMLDSKELMSRSRNS